MYNNEKAALKELAKHIAGCVGKVLSFENINESIELKIITDMYTKINVEDATRVSGDFKRFVKEFEHSDYYTSKSDELSLNNSSWERLKQNLNTQKIVLKKLCELRDRKNNKSR